MKAFYIDINNFKKTHSREFLEQYLDIETKTEKRFYEYTIGRYLIKTVGEKVFGLSDTEIIKNKDGKPIFKNANLYFNLSHSNRYIITVFDENPCGIDLEYIKPRNLEKLSKYYNLEFASLTDFYEFWTKKEAAYKSGIDKVNFYTTKFKNEYMLTVTSKNIIDTIEINEYF